MKTKAKTILLTTISILIAIALIAAGSLLAWRSFLEFENSVIDEKDSQLYSITKALDTGFNNNLATFSRECENAFEGTRPATLEKHWNNNEMYDRGTVTSEIVTRIKRTALINNPLVVQVSISKGKTVLFNSDSSRSFEYLTDGDEEALCLCRDEEGDAYVACKTKSKNGFVYVAVLNLFDAYMQFANDSFTTSGGLLMYNSEADAMISVGSDNIKIIDESETRQISKREAEFFRKCNKSGVSKSSNIGSMRMYVLTSDRRINKNFDIGVVTSYTEAINPSQKIAKNMILYIAIAFAGVALLLIILVLIIRANHINKLQVEDLQQRNKIMEDINQQMQALAHHQRLETIGTMTAGLAHDFNNLLTPIMGYSMMTMEQLPENSDLYDNLLEIYNSSCKAKDIVARLTELSRKGDEKTFKGFSPDSVVDSAIKTTLPAKPKTVKIHGSLNCMNVRMKGDETQISQLVMNLVLNAYDAMRETGGLVSVSTEADNDNITIIVKDDGPGMDADVIAKIFDPFFTTKESGKGTGLGLAIVAQIAESHDGKIYVDSKVGKGTVFKAVFPICKDE